MASLQVRAGWFHLHFRFQGRQYSHALKTKDRREAEAQRGTLDRVLIRIRNQEIPPPPATVDVAEYLLSGGKAAAAPEQLRQQLTVKELADQYVAAHSNGALEPNSLTTVRLHLKHITTALGERVRVHDLTAKVLQQYLDQRSRKKGKRQRPLSPVTLKKEMATLRAAWNWAVRAELVTGNFPGRSLTYPKTDEKPPFQTREEIERKVARGGLTKDEIADLWACLFLTKADIAAFLELARSPGPAHEPFLFPMIAFAAHTGARRSELMRMRIDDVNLETGFAVVREKKRMKGHRSTRRVPISPFLKGALADWIARHPGGSFLFCLVPEAGDNGTPRALHRSDAQKHFRRLVRGTKWEVVRGWHVLRHSFVSVCAADGVDQRVLQGWVGHLNEATHRRYTHLIPSHETAVIGRVFG